ncbi:uncharacterized protein LOC131595803 [Vicia villosa]|uniref:uncharacterized protein LOC131595803 n=1 Tax=Vicia villosa TaxID=3911 RepID=UPI00273AEA20|nr:uncharacterized protein LOC131595803 [Vicia villosa]XP_058724262.1 uncharacterized protein LOC131595803 [Vicia villosa]XP_058724263.1 uncharacterized protein LOC131595803 [Vicia villosa]XP_058724264.1 uncharacterized protein LOC131595803 [Vicia villosa]XP_058724265.1 uncharacterized protein LOC131595803 [Vicia villosa]
MDILISVVGKVAEYTVAPIGRQASYLICYKANFKTLADHVKDLEDERERMMRLVEEEERKGKTIFQGVESWIENVKEITEKANHLQNDPRHANVRCSAAWPFPNLISRHQLSRKATKIAKDVVQVQGKKISDPVGFLPALDGVASSSSTRGDEKYETRESLKQKIMKALKDPNSCNIGVYGLGGVGKTTLVKDVFQIAKQQKLFDEVVKTHVSKNPELKTIQGEIADMLGLRFLEETIQGRADRLRQRIKKEKSILIILDDIWTVIDLKEVGIPLIDEHNGCKLLMTSRNQDVLVQMDVPEDFAFKLELMSEKETWSLFQLMAGDVVNNRDLKDFAIQVAQKCAGLPLSITTVARAMKNKRDVQYWKDALRKLQCNNHEGVHATSYYALELSYDSLESDEVRDLFLLYASIPNQNVEYYLKVAMGLDILNDVKTIDDARNKHYTIIKSLEARCLLLESKTSGLIIMHDVVRDFATSIARRDKHVFLRKFADEEWPTNDLLNRCTQIILHRCHHMDELPQRIDCPCIKFFYLCSENRSLEIPHTFFEDMKSLKMLDLTSLNLPSLPTSFRFLTDLRSLCLDDCILENMDAIEALQNLEILRLWKSSMIMLPREIGRLTQLKMLDLSHSGIEVVPPNLISSLTKLEELYMGDTSINWADVNSTVQNENASIAELRMLPNLTALELQIRETWMLPRDLQLMFEKLKRYKIAIGDVWEWSDIENESLRTLMLKLGTNIHLEHGIKALIKSVENLYLDDVDGIQNVLYQLNGEGFPYLKHLHVQNNAHMNHIVDSKERNQIHVSFPILETLVLDNLKNLEHICHGPLSATSFGSLNVIKVKNCFQLKYLLSFTLIKELSHLSKIEVCQCNSMKEIVSADNNSSANNEKIEFLQLHSLTLEHLETLDNFFSNYLTHSTSIQKSFFNAQVAFPNLDTLKLSSLNLSKIWDDYSMYNLTSLIVEDCGGLKYLFSSTVVRSFKNLKHLEISNCPLMEEVIAKEERKNLLDEVPFSKLEKIILKDMDNLKTIWHHQFESLKSLEVNNCEKIVVVFPSSIQTTYNKLEILKVTNCAFVEEIFELTFNCVEGTSNLKEVNIDGLPKLKKIWSKDPQRILSFQNLTNVQLIDCEILEYLLPFSVATCCSHLKELVIKQCSCMKEIVAEEKETRLCEAPIFEFNQLNTLVLWNTKKLKCFYVGKHTLLCPSLKDISVVNCLKLNLFRTLSTSSSKSSFQYDKLSVITQRPLFVAEEVIPNLEELRIRQKDADMILQAQSSSALFTKMTSLSLGMYENEEATFPYWFLNNVHTLKDLVVECSCFKKIFQNERQTSEKTRTQIKSLMLSKLHKLQQICEEGSQIDPVLEFLELLWILSCSSLTNLFPSTVTLNHLKYLEIISCNGLKSLITTPTAQSLVKLTILKVRNCKSLEEIITGVESVDVAFISLQVLMLECLPSLNKFCSSKFFLKFPLLEKVIVRECPYMKIFSEGNTSTPNLRKVKIAENEEEWHWKGNLNDTIKKMFEDKVAFSKFKYLALSDHPVLKDLWYVQVDHQNVFCNLKHLLVQRCDFLSHILFPSNVLQVLRGLEELVVYNCDSLETIFDVKGMKSNESTLIKQSCQLKTLTLSCLPNLKHIWNEDPHEIMNFGNICSVNVSLCQSLLYIFSLPLCQDLGNLEMLEIDSCGVEDIVSMKEGSMEISFNFPQLNALVLRSLTNLKSFYQGKHTLECPSLKTLNVYRCETLRMFSFNNLDLRQPDEYSHQALFSMEKLSTNLEELAINASDAFRMLNDHCQENFFPKIQFLRLQGFDETPTIFLNDFLAILPKLTTLQLRNSCFETLFPSKGTPGNLDDKLSKKIKELWLYELEKVKYILHEGLPLDLEVLYVNSCPSLISLVSSSTSFTNLTTLEVENCKEMIYLITSSTAKSLVQLKELKIKNCDKMLDVVKIDDEKVEEDVIFENLETLKFISLLSLRSFSNGKQTFIFPSLVRFVVKSCPQMKNFSLDVTEAPYLTGIEVADKNIRWKGDLNTTIEQLFLEKEAPHSNGTIL